MRTWLQGGILLDPDVRRHADAGREHAAAEEFWPNCWRCSLKAKRTIKVVAYGVKDTGLLSDRTPYTDFFARCNHGLEKDEEQVIRIEGFRWDDWAKDGHSGDTIARLVAIKKLPFFKPGSEVGLCIPAHVFKNFLSTWRGL